MPSVETISIINKSGKVVSTSKHLVNLFRDAKEAYQEKKAEIKAEYFQKYEEKAARRMLKNRRIEEVQSEAGSRHSHRHRSGSRDKEAPRRPALTERNLSIISEAASVTSSRRSSRHGSERSPRSPHSPRSPLMYQAPYFENADISRPDLARRHTDSLQLVQVSHSPMPTCTPLQRAASSPIFGDDIDMHLAYGDIPPPQPFLPRHSSDKVKELHGLMSRFDKLMLEAQCIQHSAASIMSTLQKNPEAMAAVALTLAEISNILAKMGPSVLVALKGSSPALFALLASPQFLIASGVAVGVTIVMFGGYKIVKKIQENAAEKKEAMRMDEALVYDGDLHSIESWRRGIAEEEARSVATSVDGEFITPEAARQRKEKIRDRAREERTDRARIEPDPKSEAGSVRTTKRGEGTVRTTSRRGAGTVVSESHSSATASTVKPRKEAKERKANKSSALTVLFKKGNKSEKETETEKARSKGGESHKPKLLEM